MRDSKSWIGSDATSAVPIDLIANMEQQIAAEQDDSKYDSSDEDYSYDEDSDGELVKRKSQFIRYNNDTEIPHFALSMVFRIKNQFCKALRRYGLVTKRSIRFIKSESDRQASGSGTAPQAQASGSATSSGSATASARTTIVPQASAPGTKASRFKPPRKRAATTEAGPSTSGVTGTGAKRGRRKAASSIPSYSYFTCSGNY
ncbi:putative polygalacturonase [Hordeum vulgare]|nr:putative polygalacturonase [Hordeum vulgare]